MGFPPCKAEKPLGMELQEKEAKKKEPTVNRFLLIYIYIIGQRKAFHRERVPESSCAIQMNIDSEPSTTFYLKLKLSSTGCLQDDCL